MLKLHIPKIRIARFTTLVMVTLCFGLLAATTLQADTRTVISIEEDWEVVLGTPDTNSTSPQIRSVLSPSGDLDSAHAAFTLNHHSQPKFSSGGMQLQVWYGEALQASQSNPETALLSHQGETVRWTQRMSIANGVLTFEILNGTSTTWGTFGGEGHLKLSIKTDRTNLNSYHPDVSVNNSEVGFAANRVESFGRREIRVYTDEGLLWTGNGPRSRSY